jgi:hypothetical protein
MIQHLSSLPAWCPEVPSILCVCKIGDMQAAWSAIETCPSLTLNYLPAGTQAGATGVPAGLMLARAKGRQGKACAYRGTCTAAALGCVCNPNLFPRQCPTRLHAASQLPDVLPFAPCTHSLLLRQHTHVVQSSSRSSAASDGVEFSQSGGQFCSASVD